MFPYSFVGLGLFSGATGQTQGIGFWTNPGGTKTEVMRILSGGNIGIGTTNPQTNLHIAGAGTSINGGNSYQYSGGGLIIQANTGGRSTTTGAQLEFVIPASTDGSNLWGQGRIITVAGNYSSGNATGKMILGTRRSFNKLGTGAEWYYGDDLIIDGNGNVGVGTIDPGNYKLAVKGNIHAQQVNVDMLNWADYVFKPTYHLPSLSEIKTYIDQNQHLPGMPSEQEVAKNGVNLGEMVKLQTKKIEELTLYLIEKDQKDVLKDHQLQSQQAAIDQLKLQLEVLTKELHKN